MPSSVSLVPLLSVSVLVLNNNNNLSLHSHHQEDSCIQMCSDESHFNVLFIVRDKPPPPPPPPHTHTHTRTHICISFARRSGLHSPSSSNQTHYAILRIISPINSINAIVIVSFCFSFEPWYFVCKEIQSSQSQLR